MNRVLLSLALLALLSFLGAISFSFWGAIVGPIVGLAAILLLPRVLRSNPAFARPVRH